MFDSGTLLASLFWGSVGSGIFLFGWKQKSVIPLSGGLLMVAISYFVPYPLEMSVISLLIIAGMYWLKKRGE